jgi:dinuclear metal center YbgI/SA1388 family protein
MELAELTAFLDRELRLAEIPDYPHAHNGLQLEAAGPVRRVAAAVDASLPVIEQAVAAGSDLLLVHHGIFWQGTRRITGPWFRKLRTAIDGGLAIYAAHLPLDVHPHWGNNTLLAAALGLTECGPFLEWQGLQVGLAGMLDIGRDELAGRVAAAVGGPVHVCAGGPARVRRVGVVTGGGGGEVAAVAAAGIDTFVTGEGPHWSFPLAEELGINVLYAGHYATETLGVQALAAELALRFDLAWEFLDHPSGL